MKVYRKKFADDLDDIKCDGCGKSTRVFNTEDDSSYYEYAMLLASWGPMAQRKGEQHTCDLCEACYEKVINYIVYQLKGDIHISK